jgi:hypothetical protein
MISKTTSTDTTYTGSITLVSYAPKASLKQMLMNKLVIILSVLSSLMNNIHMMKSTSDFSSFSSFYNLFMSSLSEENKDMANNTFATPLHSSQNTKNYYEYDDTVSQMTINRYQPVQHLPQWPSTNPNTTTATKPPDDKIFLVVYSGPTSIPGTVGRRLNSMIEAKLMLHKLNFDYFLKYGIQCQIHDTDKDLGEHYRFPTRKSYLLGILNVSSTSSAIVTRFKDGTKSFDQCLVHKHIHRVTTITGNAMQDSCE